MVSTGAGVSPTAVGNSGTQFGRARWNTVRPGIMIYNCRWRFARLGTVRLVADSWFFSEATGCL